MTVDKPEFELRWPPTLRWLRQRYEWMEAQLSSTRPTPGKGTLEDSTAHEHWVTDNVGLFAEESLLLREIAARTADVAAGAHQRSDIVPAVAGIFPALREEEPTLPASLIEKLAIYHESYAEPGQPIADVLRAGVAPGTTTRYRELASIANDLGVVLDATADAEEVLYALTSLGVDPDAPDLAGGPSHSYQEYVVHGVFSPYGRRTQGPVSSLDDHYIGPFGDDWGSGWEPAYDIGPSGTDEEHYAELGQYHIWLTARALRTLEAGGQKAIPHGTTKVDLDRLLTVDVGPWLLDRDDPAIRAAAALQDRDLAANLFNTPNTQAVLTIARNELRHLGLDKTSAAAPVREAAVSQAAEPWLPGNVGALLTAARSPELPAELVGLAPTASTADLLAWVEQAQLSQPARPEALGVAVARTAAEALNGEHAEQLLVLNGLRRELEAAGPWWRPSTWRRHGELRARIAQRAQVAERLRVQADRADAEFGRAVRQHQADRAAWDATHGVVISLGAAAVQELQRREDALLDDYLYDPPQHLLEAIGPPPPDRSGQRAWREQALQVERARAARLALEHAAPTSVTSRREADLARAGVPGDGGLANVPSDTAEAALRQEFERDPESEPEPESDSVSTWRHWHEPRRDSHGEIDRQHEPELDLEIDIDL